MRDLSLNATYNKPTLLQTQLILQLTEVATQNMKWEPIIVATQDLDIIEDKSFSWL